MLSPMGFETWFWTRAKQNKECWEWPGSKDSGEYGQARVDGRRKGTHQIAWELTNGPIPEGMMVLHRCDNPPCCNPKHLYLGTHANNMDDMVKRKRQPRKLTEAQVFEIKKSLLKKKSMRSIAKEHGVSHQTIFNIAHGKKWAHVKGP